MINSYRLLYSNKPTHIGNDQLLVLPYFIAALTYIDLALEGFIFNGKSLIYSHANCSFYHHHPNIKNVATFKVPINVLQGYIASWGFRELQVYLIYIVYEAPYVGHNFSRYMIIFN